TSRDTAIPMTSGPCSRRSRSAVSSSRSSGLTRRPKEPFMTVSWESIANDHILGIAPYEPGKPIEELEREFGLTDVIKLASNENPLPPSERVLKAIADALPHLNRYPDGSAHYLRVALARRHGLTPDQLIMGNGSNELIELVVRAFLRPGARWWCCGPFPRRRAWPACAWATPSPTPTACRSSIGSASPSTSTRWPRWRPSPLSRTTRTSSSASA